MPTTEFHVRIPNMRCDGCATRVANVLERIEGVRSAEVSFEEKSAEVEITDGSVEVDDLKAAVEKAGYTVET